HPTPSPPLSLHDALPISVTSLMLDPSRGVIRPEILDEKVLSAIVEIKTRLEDVPSVLKKIKELSRELATVVSLGVSTRCGNAGEDRKSTRLNSSHRTISY